MIVNEMINSYFQCMANEKIKIVFGSNLRRLRDMNQMTQAALASKAGVVGNYIALLERAVKFPSAKMIERLAAVLEVESTEFFQPIAEEFSNPWGME